MYVCRRGDLLPSELLHHTRNLPDSLECGLHFFGRALKKQQQWARDEIKHPAECGGDARREKGFSRALGFATILLRSTTLSFFFTLSFIHLPPRCSWIPLFLAPRAFSSPPPPNEMQNSSAEESGRERERDGVSRSMLRNARWAATVVHREDGGYTVLYTFRDNVGTKYKWIRDIWTRQRVNHKEQKAIRWYYIAAERC